MINRSIELLGFLKAAVISSLSLFAVCWVSDLAAANEQVDFEEVAMIFVTKCLECHSETEKQAGLILTNRTSLITGGESGHAIVPHNSANSLLLEKIESGEMPPPKKGVTQALAKHEVDLIKNWIEQGAVWPTNRELDLYER